MKRKKFRCCICSSICFLSLLLNGCSRTSEKVVTNVPPSVPIRSEASVSFTSSATKKAEQVSKKGFKPFAKILEPDAAGLITHGNTVVTIDTSYSQEGYIMVKYCGSNPKVKLQITGSDQIIYTYDLHNIYEAFPLTSGSGTYTLNVFENVRDCEYTTAYSTQLTAQITNKYGSYLYPNQYVYFTANSKTVKKAAELADKSSGELDFVNRVYHYITSEITYDYEKANSVKSGYLPNVDTILLEKKGICFDYAVLMAAMLRSQGIPTRLEIGYAGEEYHSWIRIHLTEKGTIGTIFQSTGSKWTLIDPTFAANNSKQTDSFIMDTSNYNTKYVY